MLDRLDSRAQAARAFLIQLVAREIQLSARVAGWLRTTGQHVTALGMSELADECVRLAAETWELREQLVGLVHRLVARRNRGLGRRRINVVLLLEQPLSDAMVEFVDLNEVAITSATPWAELAALSAVERMLAGAVPIAIDIAGIDDDFPHSHGDLVEAAQLYEQRSLRARALYEAISTIRAANPKHREITREITDRAIDIFTKITSESAELGRQLDSWRHSHNG
ncbi:hypothetical protein [Enhygromyxa salina]|uniref:hypothetical protein n=1 Tax=Enhygromyxa salina TaxID=215803 RepID=UPI0015E5B1EA|nr:hypothetical protein [Enhygromyxa salina]